MIYRFIKVSTRFFSKTRKADNQSFVCVLRHAGISTYSSCIILKITLEKTFRKKAKTMNELRFDLNENDIRSL